MATNLYLYIGDTDWGYDFSDGLSIRKVSTLFHTYGVEYSSKEGNEYILFYIRRPDGKTVYGPKVKKSCFNLLFFEIQEFVQTLSVTICVQTEAPHVCTSIIAEINN